MAEGWFFVAVDWFWNHPGLLIGDLFALGFFSFLLVKFVNACDAAESSASALIGIGMEIEKVNTQLSSLEWLLNRIDNNTNRTPREGPF